MPICSIRPVISFSVLSRQNQNTFSAPSLLIKIVLFNKYLIILQKQLQLLLINDLAQVNVNV